MLLSADSIIADFMQKAGVWKTQETHYLVLQALTTNDARRADYALQAALARQSANVLEAEAHAIRQQIGERAA